MNKCSSSSAYMHKSLLSSTQRQFHFTVHCSNMLDTMTHPPCANIYCKSRTDVKSTRKSSIIYTPSPSGESMNWTWVNGNKPCFSPTNPSHSPFMFVCITFTMSPIWKTNNLTGQTSGKTNIRNQHQHLSLHGCWFDPWSHHFFLWPIGWRSLTAVHFLRGFQFPPTTPKDIG